MSRTELQGEGLVILPSPIAPGPAGGESGHPTRSVIGLGESLDEEVFHIEPPASNAWASSRSAVRSDTGVVAWRLTPKAISHLFGSPNPPYRRVDEILGLRVPGNVERGRGGTSKP